MTAKGLAECLQSWHHQTWTCRHHANLQLCAMMRQTTCSRGIPGSVSSIGCPSIAAGACTCRCPDEVPCASGQWLARREHLPAWLALIQLTLGREGRHRAGSGASQHIGGLADASACSGHMVNTTRPMCQGFALRLHIVQALSRGSVRHGQTESYVSWKSLAPVLC